MLNQVVLVGRLVRNPELRTTDSNKSVTTITLAIPRSFKNMNGEYDTDFLDCTLWTGIAENTAEYCKSGDTIGVKGRLQTWLIENEDGTIDETILMAYISYINDGSLTIPEGITEIADSANSMYNYPEQQYQYSSGGQTIRGIVRRK